MLTKWPEPLIATAPLFACLVPVLGLVVSRPPLCGLVCHRLCRWMGPVAVGAAGYVVKSAAADELSRAIEAVTNGRQFISALVGETVGFQEEGTQGFQNHGTLRCRPASDRA
jgi:hypothetical protein